MPDRSKPRLRWLRVTLITLAAVVGVVVLAAVVFIATFNANSWKPRIIAAVQAATGRRLALNGPIGLKFSLHPTIEVRDAALANPPGFSRADMARLRAVDLQLDLVPLLDRRIEVRRLVLLDPDILLERTAAGEANWRFARPVAQPAAPAGSPTTSRRGLSLAFTEIRIENGSFAYRDDRTGHVAAIAVRRLDASAPPGAPLHLTAEAAVNGLPVTASVATGALDALASAPGATPWPVTLSLAAAGATLHVAGTIARPLQGSGYKLTLDGSIPELAALAPLAPNAKLPPLRALTFSARLADSGGPIPQVSTLTLRAGASDLSAVLAGLQLDRLAVSLPALDQPVHAELAGSYGGAPLTLAASLGAPATLLRGQPAGPFPVDITATAAGATLAVKGGIADPAHLTGLDLNTSAQVPDLAALSPLAGRKLPPLKNVAFQAHLTAPDGLLRAVALHDAKLTSAPANLTGDASLSLGRPPTLTARLESHRLDLDAVLAAFRPPAAPPPPNPPPAKPPAQATGRVIPDTKLPFDSLHDVNADIELAVATLSTGGQTWHDVSGHLVLRDGRLQLAPFKATLPAGALDLALSVDANPPTPPVTLKLRAPSLALASLLALAGQPPLAKGSMAVTADLSGSGDTPHAIAASLNGTIVATMAGGEIETRLLQQALGPVIARANPIGALGAGGTSQIRCFNARLQAHDGVATLDPFVLSSSLVTLAGTGTLNLGAETLDLHLQSEGRIGGTNIAAPMTITGGFRDPRIALNQTGAAGKAVELVIGALTGKNTPANSGASCAAAPNPVRGGTPPAAARKPKLPDAGAVLRRLLP